MTAIALTLACALTPPTGWDIDVTLGGKSPEVVWAAFLDEVFAYHDRDGDGLLSPAEAARVLPLPLADGRPIKPKLSGRVDKHAFREACRAAGFVPVIVNQVAASSEDLRISEMLTRRFAPLTRDRLRRAPDLLRSADLDEDESLDTAELLAASAGMSGKTSLPRHVPRDTVRLDIGADAHRRLRIGDDTCVVVRSRRRLPDMKTASGFLLAQFKEAASDGKGLTRAAVDDDPALSGLLGLFAHADRDGDGTLTEAELKSFLALVERGVAAQVRVVVRERGRNPFAFLDADENGRLGAAEMRAFEKLFPKGKDQLTEFPRQVEIFAAPPAYKLWCGVGIPSVPAAELLRAPAVKAPAWFAAMDANGDGYLSPREFLGPPEAFRKMDRDGDGLISVAEAVGK